MEMRNVISIAGGHKVRPYVTLALFFLSSFIFADSPRISIAPVTLCMLTENFPTRLRNTSRRWMEGSAAGSWNMISGTPIFEPGSWGNRLFTISGLSV